MRALTVSAARAAFFAFEFDAGFSGGGRYAVRRAAFAAFGLDAGIALLDGDGFPRHGLFDETLGLVAHLLL